MDVPRPRRKSSARTLSRSAGGADATAASPSDLSTARTYQWETTSLEVQFRPSGGVGGNAALSSVQVPLVKGESLQRLARSLATQPTAAARDAAGPARAARPAGQSAAVRASSVTDVGAVAAVSEQLPAVPLYLEMPLLSALDALVERVQAVEAGRQATGMPEPQSEQHLLEWADAFSKHTAAFTKRVEPIFPKAFQAIVGNHSHSAIFDTLLQLERSYALAIGDLCQRRDAAVQELNERQARELELATKNGDPDLNEMAAQHEEDRELLQATWASQLDEMHSSQLQEYRDFVVKIYEELVERDQQAKQNSSPAAATTAASDASAAGLANGEGEPKLSRPSAEILKLAPSIAIAPDAPPPAPSPVQEHPQISIHDDQPPSPPDNAVQETPDQEPSVTANDPAQSSDPADATTTSPKDAPSSADQSQAESRDQPQDQPQPQPQDQPQTTEPIAKSPERAPDQPRQDSVVDKAVQELCEMGFEADQVTAALEIAERDTERAVMLLLENPKIVKEHMRAKEAARKKAVEATLARRDPSKPGSPSLHRSSSFLNLQLSRPRASETTQRASGTPSAGVNALLAHGTGPRGPVGGHLAATHAQSDQTLNAKRSFSFTRQFFQSGQGAVGGAAGGGLAAASASGHGGQGSTGSVGAGTSGTGGAGGSTRPGPSPLTRMGSFIEKAMEAFRIDDESKVYGEEDDDGEDVNDGQVDLSESFTIYFGSQVRVMYSVMLQTRDSSEAFVPLAEAAQAMAVRAQMCSALYSQSVSGIVVLLRRKDFAQYGQGTTANRELIQRCKMTTEFHFDSIEKQLNAVADELASDENGSRSLVEGDFFVTRHSNLPSAHVVFHLVFDESNIKADLTSKSPLIAGYRSILQTAHLCNVHNLTIPLLMLPDHNLTATQPQPQPDQHTPFARVGGLLSRSSSISLAAPAAFSDAAVVKRAEAVLKHTKGLLTEQTRMLKHLGGQSANVDKFTRSLVFQMPRGLRGVHEVFGAVRERLADIFRTS
ncbi:hypothetical protein BC831DRAFT_441671 [Entophlyctis helioformis]|nr:hypothetical protein BC831DRAFT_441671 [Entophlyctis helioformis]